MSDSPKCFKCIGEGKVGQTYKIVNKPYFKCSSCGHVTSREIYTELDMEWRTKPLEWLKMAKAKVDAMKSKPAEIRLKEIEKQIL